MRRITKLIVRIKKTLKLARDTLYSVMQSDWNSFVGDVVFDSFNMAYRYEDSILDQYTKRKIFLDLYYKDLKFLRCLK